MDSDPGSNSSVRSSRTAAFRSSATIPPSPSLGDPQFERGPRGEQFLIVDHTANQRNGSEVSKIWFHGRRNLFNNRRTRAAVSSVAARLTASTAGPVVRSLAAAAATLQQQGLSLYIMESEQHILLLHQVLRHHFLIRKSTLLHTLEGPRLRAPASEPHEGEGGGSARLASVTGPTDRMTPHEH
jgi:hypothetical protein